MIHILLAAHWLPENNFFMDLQKKKQNPEFKMN